MLSSSAAEGNTSALPMTGVIPFDFDPRTRVIFGAGVLQQLGELALSYGRHALLVSDHGLQAAGHFGRTHELLLQAGLQVTAFTDVHHDPTTEDVDRCLAVAQDAGCDVIVGLGGGSSLDCAKGANFLLTNGGQMEDYWGTGKAKWPMLPMIAIPTTAGTGSEAQSYAVIAQRETHMKMACGDKKAACRVALLDPELTLSLPPVVTAVTGIDAISHALEAYVTTKRNPISNLYARQAWQLLAQGLPRVLQQPRDIDARGAMLLGAHLAGAAIENSMLGATHACANPLSAHFGMTHGVAIGIMLPHVIRYNASTVGNDYAELAALAGVCAADDPTAADQLANFLTQLVTQAGQPTRLGECPTDRELLAILAEEAAQQWTGKFNPRPVTAAEFKELYQCAW